VHLTTLAYILLSGLLGVVGQVILKRGVAAVGPLALRPETATMLALSPLVILGLAVYVSGTFFWLLVLSRVDLSYAYPFASLNYVLVLLASWWVLGEQPTLMRTIGVVAICLGVWAVARTPATTAPDRRSRMPLPTRVAEGGMVR
jgi:drug/metabolite transporter (DMT)-like permease